MIKKRISLFLVLAILLSMVNFPITAQTPAYTQITNTKSSKAGELNKSPITDKQSTNQNVIFNIDGAFLTNNGNANTHIPSSDERDVKNEAHAGDIGSINMLDYSYLHLQGWVSDDDEFTDIGYQINDEDIVWGLGFLDSNIVGLTGRTYALRFNFNVPIVYGQATFKLFEKLTDGTAKQVHQIVYNCVSNYSNVSIGDENTIGVWLNDTRDSVSLEFTTAGKFTGFGLPIYWASNGSTGALAEWKMELFEYQFNTEYTFAGTPVRSKSINSVSDNNPTAFLTFDEPLPAGTYIVKFTLTNQGTANDEGKTCYLVLPKLYSNPDESKFSYSDPDNVFNFIVKGEDGINEFFVANPEPTEPTDDPAATPSEPSPTPAPGEWRDISSNYNIGPSLKKAGDYAAAVFAANDAFSALRIPKYWASNNERLLELCLYRFTGSIEQSLSGTPIARKEFSARANGADGIYIDFPAVNSGVYVVFVRLLSVEGAGYFALPSDGNTEKAQYVTTDGSKTFNFGLRTASPASVFGVFIGISIPDNAFREYLLSNVDLDNNYILSDLENEAVVSLELSGLGISSLNGIDYFRNLTSLDCKNNQLSEIDLSGITQLECLECSGNNIAMIDISMCPNLVEAVISGEITETAQSITYSLDQFALTTDKNVVIHTGNSEFDQFVLINEENFPDEIFREYISQFDLDGDNYLTIEELANVKIISIDVNSYIDIMPGSIKGIEYFFNLEELRISCWPSDIDNNGWMSQDCIELDETDLSRNTKLTVINTYSVYFNSLTLGSLSLLESFYMEYGGCPILDFDQTPNVINITLSSADIEEVRIGSLDKLQYLYCVMLSGVITISHNLRLIDIIFYSDYDIIESPWCDFNGNEYHYNARCYNNEEECIGFELDEDIQIIVNIPVDETLFTDEAFLNYIEDYIDLDSDGFLSFEEIDTVQSINIENAADLNGIEYFRNMILLDCANCNLSDLDLSHLPNLANAVAYGGRTEIDGIVMYEYEDSILVVSSDVSIYTGIPYYDNRIIINEVNFPDENFREYTRTLDLNGDGGLVQSELDAVTAIVIDGLGVKALDGIEYFSNMTSLSIAQNQITELNMALLSDLVYLDCSGNPIIILDLSAHQGFAEAVAFGTRTVVDGKIRNEKNGFVLITSTDMSLYTGIQYYDNRVIINEANFPDDNFREYIRTLDLNGDGGLVQIELDSVSEIVINGCDIENLTGIELFTNLVYLDCSDNPIDALDLSFHQGFAEAVAYGTRTVEDGKVKHEKDGVVLITDVSVAFYTGIPGYDNRIIINNLFFPDDIFRDYVRVFDLNGDGGLTDDEMELVTEINVDGLGIVTLDGIGFFRNLIILSCRDNNLEELNISANVSLERLYCEGNAIESLYIGDCDVLETVLRNATVVIGGDVEQYSYESGVISVSAGTLILTGDIDFDNRLMIDDIRFPDANFRDYIISIFGLGERRYLYESEYTTYTYIDVSGRNIASLQGIEYFAGLKVLYCGYNQIAELDLSSNVFLEELYCYCNQLIELDLSANVMLKQLDCHDNQLTELDLSANVKLNGLNCNDNRILTLNTSTLSDLQTLYCVNNIFKVLDLSNKTNLFYLAAASEFLETLIVDGCTSLGSITFNNGSLVSISARNCTLLSYINCYDNLLEQLDITGCNALTQIEVSYNKLTDLDVSGLNMLTYLCCDNNNIKNLKVNGCSSLFSLQASNNKIKNLDLTDCIQLRILYLFGNSISLLDISECTYLRNDFLKGRVNIGISSWAIFTGIEVSENNFPDEIFRSYVADQFDTNGSMILNLKEIDAAESIDLQNAGISSFKGLEYLNKIISLRVSGNPISEINLAGQERLSIIACQDTNIVELEISDCPNLVDAYVNGTVSSESGSYIVYDSEFGYIAVDRTMVVSLGIPIDAEHFPDDNFRSFVQASYDANTNGYLGQTEREKITSVSVSWRSITNLEGISYFINLISLDCYGNQLEQLDLSSFSKLQSLNCENNRLTQLDLSANTRLTYLNCAHNLIAELDLSCNTEISHLICYGNGMTKLNILNCEKLIEAIREGEKESTEEYDRFYYSQDYYAELLVDKTLKISTGKEPAIVYSLSSTLNGTVEMNVYLVLPDFIIEDPGAYVLFSKDGSEKIVMVADVLDSPSVASNGTIRYKFSYEVVAKEFRDIVNVKLFDSTGRSIQLITRTDVDYGTDGYRYPLSRYLLDRADNSTNENMRNLARAMLDYGSAAQLYFDYNVDDTIVVTDAVSGIQYSEFDPYESLKSDDTDKPEGFIKNTFSLILEGDTSLKMYYNFEAGYDPFSYQYYIDGNEAVLQKEGEKYFLIVEDIVAKELDVAHEFTISDGEKSYSIISSALSYARYLAGQSALNKQNLGKALLVYNRMAKDYFDSLSS